MINKKLSDCKIGILINAHIYNIEITTKYLNDIDFNCQIHIVTVDQEHSVIKQYLESISNEKPNVQFIYVKEDLSHIFEINEALSKNHLICFTGDRYFEHSKTMQAELLEKDAHLPAGTFMLASRFKTPIAYVNVMKEPN